MESIDSGGGTATNPYDLIIMYGESSGMRKLTYIDIDEKYYACSSERCDC